MQSYFICLHTSHEWWRAVQAIAIKEFVAALWEECTKLKEEVNKKEDNIRGHEERLHEWQANHLQRVEASRGQDQSNLQSEQQQIDSRAAWTREQRDSVLEGDKKLLEIMLKWWEDHQEQMHCLSLNLLAEGKRQYVEGLYEQALESFDIAILLNPRYGDAYVHKGHCLDVLGKPNDALAMYYTAKETGTVDEDPNKAIERVQGKCN